VRTQATRAHATPDGLRVREPREDMDRLLTITEVCTRLGVHRSTLLDLRRHHGFPAARLITPNRLHGGQRFSLREVEAWIAARPTC